MSKKIVVTGGRGFIGSYIPEWADRHGFEAVPFDLAGGKLQSLNVVHRDDVEHGIPEDTHAVIHLAGVLGTSELFDEPHDAIDVNIHGALNVIERCTKIGAGFVGITMPDSGWANVYTATKHCARDMAEAWRRHKGLKVSNVCAFNAYGPGQAFGPGHPQKIVPTFATKAWQGESIEIWGDGTQTVDLVHARDIGRMMVDAARFGSGETFDAGTGVAMTVNEVADLIRGITGSTAPHQYLPMRNGEDNHTEIIAKGRGWDLLDWRPEFNEAEFTQCVDWYREALLNLQGREGSR